MRHALEQGVDGELRKSRAPTPDIQVLTHTRNLCLGSLVSPTQLKSLRTSQRGCGLCRTPKKMPQMELPDATFIVYFLYIFATEGVSALPCGEEEPC